MKMVNVGPNPNYKLPAKKDKATPEEAAAWSNTNANWTKIKAERPKLLPYVSAMDNMRNSGGMYAILPDAVPEASVGSVRMPEDMTADELKITALQLGVDLSKPMKKSDLVKVVRKAMDAVTLLEDDEDEA